MLQFDYVALCAICTNQRLPIFFIMVPLLLVEFCNALQLFARRTWIQTGRTARDPLATQLGDISFRPSVR